VSGLRLKPKHYYSALHFFRTNGYTIAGLYERWINIAKRNAKLVWIAGRLLFLGDHIKISKEGQHMPDIQMLHQDSQNSGKPEYIAGHTYGQVSAVITDGVVSRSLPLMTELQKSPPKQEGKKEPDGDTLVVQMINLVNKTAESIKERVVVALDAYFSSKAAWAAADRTIMEDGERRVEIVTRAQSNTVGYTLPEQPAKKKRGRPRKYGKRIVLNDLFSNMSSFTESEMVLYGKKTKVKYLCLDLLWRPVEKLVRFVAVESDSGRCVFMSTSLTLTAEEIISIYTLRFKIETSFDDQKNDMGSFAYHFWTAAMPKFKKWKKVVLPSDEKYQRRINETRAATSSFVCLATIATGILTIIAFSHNSEIWDRYSGWVRTLRSNIPTISIVKETLTQDFATLQACPSVFSLFNIIRPWQRINDFLYRKSA
jgi:hypothetical protein